MIDISLIKAEALAREATQLMEQGKADMAHALLTKALSLDPQQALALRLLQRLNMPRSPWYSVVIPTCNRLDILKQCLSCLAQQSMPYHEFEVIVVDDASTDGTGDFLQHYTAPFAFRHMTMLQRGGPARARNAAIRAAQGEIIHFLNDDTMIEPSTLLLHGSLHKSLTDIPVSVLGGFDFAPPFTETLWGYALQHSDLLFRYPSFEHNALHAHNAYYSCNISTPRRSLIEAGLFDEGFTEGAWGAEDMELGRRLEALPVPVLYREDSRSVHMHDVNVDGLARTAAVRGGGAVWLFAKHQSKPHYANIQMQDVVYWRKLPPRLTQAIEDLHAVLRQCESLKPAPDATPPPYLRRDDHSEMCHCCYSLWHMRTRELLAIIEQVKEMAYTVIKAAYRGVSLQECAKALYPAMLFIRFYHDTIGVCATDNIRKFCTDAPLLCETAPRSALALTTQKKKVLLVCNFFWPSVGGTELFVEELGQQLQKLGYGVEIACRWLPNRHVHTLHGMPIHSFHCHGKFFDPSMGPDTEKYRQFVHSGLFDAIVVLAHPDNWTCHLLRGLPESKGCLIMMPSINAENIAYWQEIGVMDTIAATLQSAHMCVSVSEHGHDSHLFEQLSVQHAFIPHAVEPAPAPYSMRQRLALATDKALLVCVGNFWQVKNQQALLQHFAAEGEDAPWQLVLAGGALPWETERKLFADCWNICKKNSNMRILGPLPPAEATALIRDADILLVPSKGESAGPLVVLEAMHFGVPWIATPECNAVHDEGGGIITDLENFPTAVRQLLNQPELAKALGHNGNRHWQQSFRWHTSAQLFDALLCAKAVTGATMPQDIRDERDTLTARIRMIQK